jgi:hypothetical protein
MSAAEGGTRGRKVVVGFVIEEDVEEPVGAGVGERGAAFSLSSPGVDDLFDGFEEGGVIGTLLLWYGEDVMIS